ncbi:hypothetical protein J2Z42_000572 [Clostridium algifaecis]|uniref:Uncharacterized protein n=1 Tax=Clostridium algifaecis TaxID=1472040 RepID=A0ABS4KPD4_9CLOT|nr:DUF960 family protein [Clostridium algifaecis]MBP2031907.1 hypothetical protein [Clostridium algifaecis]
MFNNERYITRGIHENIDEEIQIEMWNMLVIK